MDKLVYLVYPLLLLLVLWNCKLFGPKKWNEECFSLRQMKAVQGFAALGIVLHHIGQKTCASWLPKWQIIPGLEQFVPIGYLLVSIFLFCSGYGLYKSYHTKENYLQGFIVKRILPVVVSGYIVSFMYFIGRILVKERMSAGKAICYLTGIKLCNTNGWFVYALPLLYLAFYIAFKLFRKKEWLAILFVALVILIYDMVGTKLDHNDWIMCGEWWYNSMHAFLVGLLFAKFEQPLTKHIRKYYVVYLPLALLLFIPLFITGEVVMGVFSYYGESFGAKDVVFRRWVCLIAQVAISIDYLCIVWLVGMKLRIGNKVLAFFGSITLELYLVHGFFVELFSRSFLGSQKPVWFCSNVALYIVIVLGISIPLAILLKKIVGLLPTGEKSLKHHGRE